jgi:hypothetical protein
LLAGGEILLEFKQMFEASEDDLVQKKLNTHGIFRGVFVASGA